MAEYKYCPMCGVSLARQLVCGRDRLTCRECGWINFLNPLPVVACLVHNSKKEILLIKRGVEPSIGSWALPGGFIEIDETPQGAGCRELHEETGLDGKAGRLVGVHVEESRMYGFVLVVGVEFIVEDKKAAAGDDALDAKFFTGENIPNIPFVAHRKLIEDFSNIT
jgi:ADP-ribose pyrophosphatase YjhB (NUDIX family)